MCAWRFKNEKHFCFYATVERMIYGWVLASLAGIVLGAIIGSSRIAREYVAPMLEMVRPVPVSAFMPVVIAFMGIFAFNYAFTQVLLATHPEIVSVPS